MIYSFKFYTDGFKSLEKLGIRLWVIILVKLLIMFAILKIFFSNKRFNIIKNVKTNISVPLCT
ncbi:MAG: DUF4492 domain-containing protein [Candidatus Omnitrophica bacterium]|nr:DUF4492 domain-containing protein [Candidatus Omnitrophota bacterium]